MSKLKLAVGVILLILVGALIGSLGTGWLVKQRTERLAVGGPGPPPEGAAYIIERLASRLDLTPDQRAEIKQVFDEYNEEIFDIRSEYLPEIKEATDRSFTMLREKLNDRQKAKLDHLQKSIDRRHKRISFRRGRHDGRPEQFLALLMERLKLSPEQAERVRQIVREGEEKRSALSGRHRGMFRRDMRQTRDERDRIDAETEEKLSQILSEDQLKTYRDLLPQNPFGRHRRMGPRRHMGPSSPMDPG